MTKKVDWNKTKSGRKGIRELRDYNLIGSSYISEIERSKSNNSRCHKCGDIIGKNTLRGIQVKLWDTINEKKYNMRFVHCSECTIKLISERIDQLRKLRKLMKDRKRTRKVSYKKQEELQLKDELLSSLGDDNEKR